MKTKIPLFILFAIVALVLSNCMVIADLIEEKNQSATIVPNEMPAEKPEADLENASILDFPISLTNGETASLRDYQGKTVLLVFFSVHCGHCHNESSHLEAIYQDYKDQDFIILSAEVSGADATALHDFANEYGITFPLGADEGAQFAHHMEVTGVPHNVLIDRNGDIASIMRGFSDETSLRSSIELQLEN